MRNPAGALIVGVILSGCAGAPATVEGNEDFLSAAGFQVLAANTPGYAAAQQQLAPHQFVQRTEQGVSTYYYLDPTVCGCLYFGGQQNWDAYQKELAEKRHEQAQQLLIRANTPYSGQGGI